MQIELSNINKIKHASIEVGGLTVITGINDSGKSTAGKALFCAIKSRKTKCDGREKRNVIFEAKTKCAQKSRLLPLSSQNTSVVQTPFESCLNDAFLLNFLLKYHLKPIANLAKIVSLHSSYAASLYSVPSAFLNSMMSV